MKESQNRIKVLVVDDHPENLLALEAVIGGPAEDVVKARSGEEALRRVLHDDFAVILLDVNMPGMDGFETAALIRKLKRSQHTPIILFTAFSDTETHVSRGYQLGVVDYIHTPVVPEVLKTKVGVFVELFRKAEQAKRREEELRRLGAASLAINSAPTKDALLQVVADHARESVGARQALVMTDLDPTRSRLAHVVSTAERGEGVLPPDIPGPELCARAMELGEPLRIPRGEDREGFRWDKGWLSAPLTTRDGRIMGFVQVGDKHPLDFAAADEAVLGQLAEFASVALERALYREAQEANRLKDEFLATLSHELRNPLNAMLGWTALLRSGKLEAPDAARALEIIERNVKLQVKLIDDLLDISRSVSGKVRLSVAPLDLAPVVEAAVEVLRPDAEQKQIGLNIDLAPEAEVLGDPDRLEQVVRNLLSNAIKFTPKGGAIRLELRCSRSGAELTVSDTGEGISPETLPHIFESFRQEDTSSTRSHGGLGLGLAIVRHLVELHHGGVQAESRGKGQGATFSVRLPPVEEETTATSVVGEVLEAGNVRLDGLKVLVVDDEGDSRDLVAMTLERQGAEVRRAESVEAALCLFDGFGPDVVISDIAMPGEDGYSLVRRIRHRASESDRPIPALALTSFAQAEDRLKALAAGFQMHMAKPFDAATLITAVANLARAKIH